MTAQEITQDTGDDADTTYPLSRTEGVKCSPALGQVAAVLGACSVKGSTSAWGAAHCPPWGIWGNSPAGHSSHLPWEGVFPPHLPLLALGLVCLHHGYGSKGGLEPWEHPAGTSSDPGQEFMATWENSTNPNRSETSLSTG